MAKIADLFIKLGLDGQGDVSKGLDKVSGSLKELFSMSIRTKLTLAGIAAGLTGATMKFGKTSAELSNFNRVFGLSTDLLQRWQQAGENFGVGAEEMAGTIGKIQDALAQARTNEGYAETFTKMGIDPSQMKDAYQVMETLRKRVQGGQLDIMRVLSSGFLGQDVFGMLTKVQDPSKMKLARPLLSSKEIEEGRRISVSMERFGKDLSRSMDKFVVDNQKAIMATMETLKQALLSFMKFLHENKDSIQTLTRSVGELASAIGKFLDWMKNSVFGSALDKVESSAASGHGVAASIALGANQPLANLGQWMVDTVLGSKSRIYGPTQEQAGFNARKAALPVVDQTPITEFQTSKNESTFYIGKIDVTDSTSKQWKDETARLSTFKTVNAGNR